MFDLRPHIVMQEHKQHFSCCSLSMLSASVSVTLAFEVISKCSPTETSLACSINSMKGCCQWIYMLNGVAKTRELVRLSAQILIVVLACAHASANSHKPESAFGQTAARMSLEVLFVTSSWNHKLHARDKEDIALCKRPAFELHRNITESFLQVASTYHHDLTNVKSPNDFVA
eukprot:1122791-Amphidinium_carterae.3